MASLRILSTNVAARRSISVRLALWKVRARDRNSVLLAVPAGRVLSPALGSATMSAPRRTDVAGGVRSGDKGSLVPGAVGRSRQKRNATDRPAA